MLISSIYNMILKYTLIFKFLTYIVSISQMRNIFQYKEFGVNKSVNHFELLKMKNKPSECR